MLEVSCARVGWSHHTGEDWFDAYCNTNTKEEEYYLSIVTSILLQILKIYFKFM